MSEASTCRICGAPLAPGSKFCSSCGTPVALEQQPPDPEAASEREMDTPPDTQEPGEPVEQEIGSVGAAWLDDEASDAETSGASAAPPPSESGASPEPVEPSPVPAAPQSPIEPPTSSGQPLPPSAPPGGVPPAYPPPVTSNGGSRRVWLILAGIGIFTIFFCCCMVIAFFIVASADSALHDEIDAAYRLLVR